MTTQYYTGPNYGRIFLGFLLSILLGAAACILFVRNANTGALGRLTTVLTGRSPAFDTSVPVVVSQIHRLNHLQTAAYSLDTVLPGEPAAPSVPGDAQADPVADKVLLVVHGQSTAGIDLTLLKPEDVHIDASTRAIHLTLPPSQLFLTVLDNQHTRVFFPATGLLVPAGQDLQPATRAKAQDQLQQAALSGGILDAARANARASIATLLYSLGFQQVDVN
jgi:hypothetical protein